jgi:hypothetical protein
VHFVLDFNPNDGKNEIVAGGGAVRVGDNALQPVLYSEDGTTQVVSLPANVRSGYFVAGTKDGRFFLNGVGINDLPVTLIYSNGTWSDVNAEIPQTAGTVRVTEIVAANDAGTAFLGRTSIQDFLLQPVGTTPSVSAVRYRAYPIETPGFTQVVIFDQNDFGQMAGLGVSPRGLVPVLLDAFRTPERVSILALGLPAGFTRGTAQTINNAGVIGGDVSSNTAGSTAAVWVPGLPNPLSNPEVLKFPSGLVPAGFGSTVAAINDLGVMGIRIFNRQQVQSVLRQADGTVLPIRFRDNVTPTRMVITGLNNRGFASVDFRLADGTSGVARVSPDGIAQPLPLPQGFVSVSTNGIMEDGTIYGHKVAKTPTGTIMVGLIWEDVPNGSFRVVDAPSGQASASVVDGNGPNQILLATFDGSTQAGFLMENGQTFDLNSVTTGLPPGARITQPAAISRQGDIVTRLSNGQAARLVREPAPNPEAMVTFQEVAGQRSRVTRLTVTFGGPVEPRPFQPGATVEFFVSDPSVAAFQKDGQTFQRLFADLDQNGNASVDTRHSRKTSRDYVEFSARRV